MERHHFARKMQPEKIVALDAPMPFCDSAKALVRKFAVAFVDHPCDAIALVGILVGDAQFFSAVSSHAAHVATS